MSKIKRISSEAAMHRSDVGVDGGDDARIGAFVHGANRGPTFSSGGNQISQFVVRLMNAEVTG